MHRFDHFMRAALYDPERGYYTSRIKSVGIRGDFTTTPQLSPLLAKAIVGSFLKSGLRHLIEVGPGTGLLSRSIRSQLPLWARLRTQQHLVEISPPLQELQRKSNPRAKHHHSLTAALHASAGQAFVFSNELVDAFPVRIFRREGDGWSELSLEKEGPTFRETFLPTKDLPNSQQFANELPVGHRIEIHQSYHEWMADHLVHLKRGSLLTIDYTLPSTPRAAGSLRGYLLQERITGSELYRSAGHIDITTDVSFQDLAAWGAELGLRKSSLRTQTDFLAPFATDSPEDRYLTDPLGAGHAFQVLLQEKSTR